MVCSVYPKHHMVLAIFLQEEVVWAKLKRCGILNLETTALVIIDLQDNLLPKIHEAERVLERTVKLLRFARQLKLPILWAEQYPKGLGPTTQAIASELGGLHPIPKTSFSVTGDPVFAEAMRGVQRKQLLLAGVETHVCVWQTAFGAKEMGFEVFVARDAVSSRDPEEHQAGLERMRQHGVEVVTVEMAIFEILRAAGTPAFKSVLPLLK